MVLVVGATKFLASSDQDDPKFELSHFPLLLHIAWEPIMVVAVNRDTSCGPGCDSRIVCISPICSKSWNLEG